MSLSDFNQLLSELAQADQLRVRRIVDGPQDTSMVIDGQRMMSYASNDYLGLANHPKVVEAAMRALKRYGLGAGASHLVSGHMRAHHPGHRAFVRNSERRVAQCMRACYQLLCVRGTALKAEVGEAVQLGVFERQRGGFHDMRAPSTPAIRLASQWSQLITD